MDHPVQTPRSTPPGRRLMAIALIVAGAVITLLAILADELEIGTGRGFGYYQMIVLIAGLVLLLGGGAIFFQHRSSDRAGDDFEPEP
jgi:hypothetical protein